MENFKQYSYEDHQNLKRCLFEDLELRTSLLKGIYCSGYVKPSPFQLEVLTSMVEGRNIIVQSQPGKKTILAISALQLLDIGLRVFHMLLLVPNQERGKELVDTILVLGDYMPISVHLCEAGKDAGSNIEKIKGGAQLVIATPEIVTEMLGKQGFSLDTLKLLILEKTDQLLDSFGQQLDRIVEQVPNETQVAAFFDKSSRDVVQSLEVFIKEPVKILLDNEQDD